MGKVMCSCVLLVVCHLVLKLCVNSASNMDSGFSTIDGKLKILSHAADPRGPDAAVASFILRL